MVTDKNFRDEKIRCKINLELAKISALPSSKYEKYEYLVGK